MSCSVRGAREEGRLERRIRKLKLRSLADYEAHVAKDPSAELVHLFDVVTSETYCGLARQLNCTLVAAAPPEFAASKISKLRGGIVSD
jgi:hypothetical protein